MPYLRPNPVRRRAVQPQMPTNMRKNLLLYRRRFLNDTLCKNGIFDQITSTFSRKMRLPLRGAFGLDKTAGIPRSSLNDAYNAENTVHSRDTTRQLSAISLSNAGVNSG